MIPAEFITLLRLGNWPFDLYCVKLVFFYLFLTLKFYFLANVCINVSVSSQKCKHIFFFYKAKLACGPFWIIWLCQK